MKKKDILPTLGRGFILGTLFVQTMIAFQEKQMGSAIGLALSSVIFLVMNWQACRSCSSSKDCDIPKANKT
jgi:hypothetical protein